MKTNRAGGTTGPLPAFKPLEAAQPEPRSTWSGAGERAGDGFSAGGARRAALDLAGAGRGDPQSKSAAEAFPAMNLSAASSDADLRAMVRQDLWVAYGREATETDFEYWLPKLKGECDSGYVTGGQMSAIDYWHNRLLGWQAGGEDVAKAGPYAGMDFGTLESPTLWPFELDPTRHLLEELEEKRKKNQKLSARG